MAADTGAIGGDASHEFQVIADTGEDAIAYCPDSDYAANMELAEALAPKAPRAGATQPLHKTPTPGKSTCEDVAALLGIPLQRTVKSLVLATDERNDAGDVLKSTLWLLLVRGDHQLNEVKAGKLAGLKHGFRFATVAEIEMALAAGATPDRISYGNTIKKERDIARAFALVGALSIIRFRTVVKDTRDTAFVFAALAVGMATGLGYLDLAAIGAVAVALLSQEGAPVTAVFLRAADGAAHALVFGADDDGAHEPPVRRHHGRERREPARVR